MSLCITPGRPSIDDGYGFYIHHLHVEKHSGERAVGMNYRLSTGKLSLLFVRGERWRGGMF